MGDATSAPAPTAHSECPSVWPTESVRLRAEAPDSVPGPAAVLRLLGSARRADVAQALDTLSPDQLAEAVTTVALPLAPAVVAHISEHGPAPARRILARRLVEQPESVPQRPLTLDAYLRALPEVETDDPWNDLLPRLRARALEALCGATLTAEQLVEHTRPAGLTLALAVCTPADRLRPWVRRATGDIRALLARRLAEELGEDYESWAAVITLGGTFRGTFAELLHGDDATPRVWRFVRETRSDHAAQNVLLALAPRGIAARYLADLDGPPAVRGSGTPDPRWELMLSSGPLCRPLIEHVIALGTAEQVLWLVKNKLCPDSTLERVLPGHAADIFDLPLTSPHVAGRAFRSMDREGQNRVRLAWWVRGASQDQLMDLAWSLTDAPGPLHELVLALFPDPVEPSMLTCMYAALAEAAGPEPVWALELRRAGTLEQAMPEVRASMAACSAAPLIEAARRTPRRHWIDTLDDDGFGCQLLRTEAELDRTGHLPLEALVAEQLDGRPDRWRAVARRLAAAAGPVEAVMAEAAALHFVDTP
ncbi:hypothetical protein KGQ20_11385 [Catenulispora sp. NF23]|uniref:Uncharacterized protein n=1 Tax=Catenulispora pinistramenti TaxID=2705254 RepID=A0ABS5KS70_9ACTN|nr:hypothetical protein [Catenulispora pinistramenti]MBS2533375.1 hypothetical protein [Catenulispora pinistramenti]MBS2548900.1 hypothetical protein [Catenulispora pinistramenti]